MQLANKRLFHWRELLNGQLPQTRWKIKWKSFCRPAPLFFQANQVDGRWPAGLWSTDGRAVDWLPNKNIQVNNVVSFFLLFFFFLPLHIKSESRLFFLRRWGSAVGGGRSRRVLCRRRCCWIAERTSPFGVNKSPIIHQTFGSSALLLPPLPFLVFSFIPSDNSCSFFSSTRL